MSAPSDKPSPDVIAKAESIHRDCVVLGGVVDVSQMSVAATMETIALSSTPVIASLSNARAMSDVARNLSDVEIDGIAAAGGVIHIYGFGPSLVDASSPEARAGIAAVVTRLTTSPRSGATTSSESSASFDTGPSHDG